MSELSAMKPFRWAIFGTGAVSRKFAFGLRVLGSRATAWSVASRNPENARRFATDFGVRFSAESYLDALGSDIDAVYIATPPSLHEEHAKLAIGAGKALLIEKPFALDPGAAKRIADAAREAGVFCMEAMWTRFLPLISVIGDEIKKGSLGEIRGFHGTFLGANLVDPSISVFDPARGGGALMHRGVYPLSLSQLFLGKIVDVRAIGRIGATGVDEDCALLLRHEAGGISSLRTSLRVDGQSNAILYGTAGTLEIDSPIYRPVRAARLSTSLRGSGSDKRRFEAFRETTLAQRLSQKLTPLLRRMRSREKVIMAPFIGNGYHYEALALMDAVAAGKTESPLMPLDHSIAIMQAIHEARAQIEWRVPA